MFHLQVQNTRRIISFEYYFSSERIYIDLNRYSKLELVADDKQKLFLLLLVTSLAIFYSLQYSNFSTYQRMWAVMESAEPSVFTQSNFEGEERVSRGNRMYAFLMESSSIEYITERNCNLTRVGGLLDSKGYGIAMPVSKWNLILVHSLHFLAFILGLNYSDFGRICSSSYSSFNFIWILSISLNSCLIWLRLI